MTAGTTLYRLHQSKFAADAFNPLSSHRYFDGGRFDSTDDDHYGYMYAGDTPEGAVAETLLRDSPITDTGAITISQTQVIGRRLSCVVVAKDILLVDLRGLVNLRASSQDDWLTTTNPVDYPQTRHWGHWIRHQRPGAAGFIWLSKRDPVRQSLVLFADRFGAATVVVDPTWNPGGSDPDFDSAQGLSYLASILGLFNADVS